MSAAILFSILDANGSARILELAGREAWAMQQLMAAGDSGCTPIDTPGPRWSDYVFKLRRRGIEIESITEAHDGPFPGHHARYVLRSKIETMLPLAKARGYQGDVA